MRIGRHARSAEVPAIKKNLLFILLTALLLGGCAASVPAESAAPTPENSAVTEITPPPTPAPTPEPTPSPEPTPDLSPLPDEWFADAVIVGDSVSSTLEKQCIKTGDLGDVQFIVIISYSVHNAVSGEIQVWIEGKPYSLEDAVALLGANKVFIMMGVNDIALYGGVDKTMQYWETLVARIQERNPRTVLFIESCLPVTCREEYDIWNNDIIDDYNERLRALCEETGCVYVDLAHYFKDENNGMEVSLTWDYRCHVNYEGAALWIEQLRNVENYSVDPRRLAYGEARP